MKKSTTYFLILLLTISNPIVAKTQDVSSLSQFERILTGKTPGLLTLDTSGKAPVEIRLYCGHRTDTNFIIHYLLKGVDFEILASDKTHELLLNTNNIENVTPIRDQNLVPQYLKNKGVQNLIVLEFKADSKIIYLEDAYRSLSVDVCDRDLLICANGRFLETNKIPLISKSAGNQFKICFGEHHYNSTDTAVGKHLQFVLRR